MRYSLIAFLCLFFSLGILFSGCKKEEENPYDQYNQNQIDTLSDDTLTPGTFAYLHATVFSPTCANSGCHDGTFEPDFRTPESSYNTLLYHSLVKNTNDNAFEYRVVPRDVDKSMLYYRLTVNLNGNSGIMPLSVDPQSDWNEKKEEYLASIRQWIEEGAKDMFGNEPTYPDLKPSMKGVIGFADGNPNPCERNPNGSMAIPFGTSNLTLYFSFGDNETPPQNFSYNRIKFSKNLLDFSAADSMNLSIISPMQEEGYDGNPVSYTHKVVVQPSAQWLTGDEIFMRVYVQDNNVIPTEIPNAGSAPHIQTYFTLRLMEP